MFILLSKMWKRIDSIKWEHRTLVPFNGSTHIRMLVFVANLVDDLLDVGLGRLDGVEQPDQLLLVRLIQLDHLHLLVVLSARKPEQKNEFRQQSDIFNKFFALTIIQTSLSVILKMI